MDYNSQFKVELERVGIFCVFLVPISGAPRWPHGYSALDSGSSDPGSNNGWRHCLRRDRDSHSVSLHLGVERTDQ